MSTSPTRGLAAATATLTVLGAIVVAFTGCGSDSGGAALSGTAPATETAAAEPDVAAMPSGVRWESYQGVRVPFGDDGPAHTAGTGAVSGFGTLRRGRRWRRFSSRSVSGSPRTGSGPRSPRPGSRPGPNATPTRWRGSGSRSPPRSSRRRHRGCWVPVRRLHPRAGGADDLHRIPGRLPRGDRRGGGVEWCGLAAAAPGGRQRGAGPGGGHAPGRDGPVRRAAGGTMSLMTTPRTPHPDHDPAPASRSSRRTVTLVVSVVFLLILVAGGTVALLAPAATAATPPPAHRDSPLPHQRRRRRNRTGPGGAPPTSTRSGGAWRHPPTPTVSPSPRIPPSARRATGALPRRTDRCGHHHVLHRGAPRRDVATGRRCPHAVLHQRRPHRRRRRTPHRLRPNPARRRPRRPAARRTVVRPARTGALAVTGQPDGVRHPRAERQAQLARVERLEEWRTDPAGPDRGLPDSTYWAPDYAVVEIASAAPERRQIRGPPAGSICCGRTATGGSRADPNRACPRAARHQLGGVDAMARRIILASLLALTLLCTGSTCRDGAARHTAQRTTVAGSARPGSAPRRRQPADC